MASNQFLYEVQTPKKSKATVFLNILQGIVLVFALGIVAYLFLLIPNQVDGDSMMPNFVNGELLFTNKVIQVIGDSPAMKDYNYNYQRGDVVIFQLPDHPDFIKRVIGLPGDEVMLSDGQVYVNGKLIHEKYLHPDFAPFTITADFLTENEPKIVPAGHYILMGDNRNNSKDSRYSEVGFVSREYIKGKVFLRWWPLEKFGLIESGEITSEE